MTRTQLHYALRLIALTLAAVFARLPALAADIGKPAPEVVVQSADGSTQKLSDLRGKIVYVDFWASWCVPCRESFPWMNAMQGRYAGRDLLIVAVNLDEKRSDADAFLARYPAKFRVAFDPASASAKAFGVKAMPTSFIIGRDGMLLYEHRGFRESQTPAVEAEIQHALDAK